MRILVAPDKFKGCLTAAEVCEAIAGGLRAVDPFALIDSCPMADGGEGTVATLVAATGGKLFTRRVTGPLPDMRVDAVFGMLGDGQAAVIEMSAASGLALLKPEDRNPMRTTTFGTGELLNAAVELGARRIILGIGGSATVDGGIGCAQATGHTIILDDGEPVSPTEPLTGADLSRVMLVKRHRGEKTDGIEIIVACDVTETEIGTSCNVCSRLVAVTMISSSVAALEPAGAGLVCATAGRAMTNAMADAANSSNFFIGFPSPVFAGDLEVVVRNRSINPPRRSARPKAPSMP